MANSPDIETMLTEIAEVASDMLNEWECIFIEDMQSQTFFTKKQEAVIGKLYRKVCDG